MQGLPLFVLSVIKQTTTNLIRLQKLGVKKILVGALQPLGCLPLITTPSSFEHCDDTINIVVNVHNILLSQQVTKLNQETKDHNKTFVVLDLYDSFMSALMNHSSSSNFTDPLKPCCVGVSSQYFCGSVGENNEKKYKVCENPKSAFFWDVFHPTQAGWNAVYKKLQEGSLPPLLK